MSDDTLSQLVAEAIAQNLKPLMGWAYAVFASVIVGTAFVVGMVYEVRGGIRDAQRDAAQAREAVGDLRATVTGHERSITVLDSWMKWKGGGE